MSTGAEAVTYLDVRPYLTTVTPHTRSDVEIFEQVRTLLVVQRNGRPFVEYPFRILDGEE